MGPLQLSLHGYSGLLLLPGHLIICCQCLSVVLRLLFYTLFCLFVFRLSVSAQGVFLLFVFNRRENTRMFLSTNDELSAGLQRGKSYISVLI